MKENRSAGTERELGASAKTKLGVGREEKCNILFFRLPEQTELYLFSFSGFNVVYKGFSKIESPNGSQESISPFALCYPPHPQRG